MLDLLAKGTDRGYSMIGVGLSAGLSGSRRARTVQDPLPALDLDWATNRSLPASYGPTPTFTRASTGTYFDGQGILRSAAVNGPRFNHVYNGTSWVSRGLLVEDQRTNISPYSVTFNSGNAPWGMADLSISLNSATAPDGTNTATKIIEGTATGNHNIYRVFPFVGTITWSIFAKAAERNYIQIFIGNLNSPETGINVDLTNGTITNQSPSVVASGTQDVGNGWYRIWFSVTGAGGTYYPAVSTSNSATGIRSNYTGNGTSGVYIWGAQWESGSFPTSYIGNSGSGSTTRSADVCQITGSDFSGFWNGTEGSFAAEIDLGAPVTGITYYPFYFGASDTATNTKRLFYFSDIPTGTSSLYLSDGTTTSKVTTSNIPGNFTTFKAAMCYKVDDLAISLNGAAVVTDTSQPIPTGLDRFQIGSNPSANNFNGHIARLRYYPTRLTNAKLQELST